MSEDKTTVAFPGKGENFKVAKNRLGPGDLDSYIGRIPNGVGREFAKGLLDPGDHEIVERAVESNDILEFKEEAGRPHDRPQLSSIELEGMNVVLEGPPKYDRPLYDDKDYDLVVRGGDRILNDAAQEGELQQEDLGELVENVLEEDEEETASSEALLESLLTRNGYTLDGFWTYDYGGKEKSSKNSVMASDPAQLERERDPDEPLLVRDGFEQLDRELLASYYEIDAEDHEFMTYQEVREEEEVERDDEEILADPEMEYSAGIKETVTGSTAEEYGLEAEPLFKSRLVLARQEGYDGPDVFPENPVAHHDEFNKSAAGAD